MSLPAAASLLLAWLGLLKGISWLFNEAESKINEKTRKSITRWLKNDKSIVSDESWIHSFRILFDKVFGSKPLSIGFFLRSSLVSAFSFCLILLTLGAFDDPRGLGSITILEPIIVFACFNMLPDYLSLIQTRYMLSIIDKSSRLRHKIAVFFTDFQFTSFIFFVFGGLLFAAYTLVIDTRQGQPLLENYRLRFEDMWYDDFSVDRGATARIFLQSQLLTTFVTSVWLWMHGLTGLLIKTINRLGSGFKFLLKPFDIENKPVGSMGFILSILVTLGFLILAIYRWWTFIPPTPNPLG